MDDFEEGGCTCPECGHFNDNDWLQQCDERYGGDTRCEECGEEL